MPATTPARSPMRRRWLPYLLANFATTIDGHGSIDGNSGAIGSDTDTAMLIGLRTAEA